METPVLLGGIAVGRPVPAPVLARRRAAEPNATLVSRIDLTPAVAQFRVRTDAAAPPFKPGQYFALGLTVEGTLLQRPYSTSSPTGTADELEFLIRRVGGGTFTPRLWKAEPGSRIWIGPPKGLFTLQPGDQRTHLFVSTGTGLAPFISMADWLLRDDPGAQAQPAHPRIAVVHGVSYAAELAYRDRLEGWQAGGRLDYLPTVSRPDDPANAGWTGSVGRAEAILESACEELALDPAGTVAYLCGNPDMIETTTGVLLGLGFPEAAVIREHYWTVAEQR